MPNNNTLDLYLASSSPRRLELLNQFNLNIQLLASQIDETSLANEPPLVYAERMARQKLNYAVQIWQQQQLFDIPILAADTVVTFGGDILGKPKDKQDAIDMLTQLSDTKHQVISSIAIYYQQQYLQQSQISTVTFKPLTKTEIENYIATGEPMDKAGSYGIQGLASAFITNLHGSYSGVMGLPLYETMQLLQRCGVKIS